MLNYLDQMDASQGCGPLLDRGKIADIPLRQQVFQYVRAHGGAARTDITRALDISPGSATTSTADLITAGFLREIEGTAREHGRGRPPVALEVVADAAYVIGIKLSSTRHSAVLSDFAGDVVATASAPSSTARRSIAQILAEIETLIDTLLDNQSIAQRDIQAVGLGLPGIVDHSSGVVTWSPLLQHPNADLRDAFMQTFAVPLFLDNDTNMLTLSELWFGDGRDKTDFAVVTIENGVGMGLVVNNSLFRGSHGMGLELGHTKVQLDGALCRCGQRGCLEAYLGDYALIREAAVALDARLDGAQSAEQLLDDLFKHAKDGNTAAQTIFRRAGRYLSVGLANVIQLFDPPLIILSGQRVHYEDLYKDLVFDEAQELTLSNRSERCQFLIRAWDDLVWARGATVPALSAVTDAIIGGQTMMTNA